MHNPDADMDTDMIEVEVAYALPQEQSILAVRVPPGSTAKQAIEASGILQRYPQIDLETDRIGIFSKVCKLDRVLEAGDRVEIYRPLLIDPKEKRRRRAEQNAARQTQPKTD